MKTPMHLFEMLLVNMRINLGRDNIGMSEHLLHNPQIRIIKLLSYFLKNKLWKLKLHSLFLNFLLRKSPLSLYNEISSIRLVR